jgi:O-antigen/teichoic acid export membrane protein
MFVARCVAMVGPVGVAIITARTLGPQDQGRYYYIITVATLAAQVASLGIQASNTYLVSKQRSLLPNVLANTVWIAIVGGSVAALLAVLLDRALDSTFHMEAPLLFVIILCPLILLFLYLSNLAIAIDRVTLFNGLIIFNGAIPLIIVAIVAYFSPSITNYLRAVAVSGVAVCVVSWLLIARGSVVHWKFDLGLLKASMAFAARAHVATLIGFFMSRTGAVVLRHYEAYTDLGYWSIAGQISDALLLLPATISLLLFPSVVRADPAGRWRTLKSMLLRVSAVMLIMCITAAVAFGPLITFVFGTAYAPAREIMYALLPSVFFLAITSVVSQFLSAFGIPPSQLVAWAIGWGVQGVLSIMFFDRFGVVGLACAQSGAAALVCFLLGLNALQYAPGRHRYFKNPG